MHTSKPLLSLVGGLLFFQSAFGQAPMDSASIAIQVKQQATDMAGHLVSKDYTKFVEYLFPKTIADGGGKAAVIKMISDAMAETEEQGYILQKAEIGEPSTFITALTELQCTIPEILTMKVPGGTVVTTSSLIAVSKDGGNNWKFLEASKSSLEQIRKYYPNISSKLKLPDYGQPVFTKEE